MFIHKEGRKAVLITFIVLLLLNALTGCLLPNNIVDVIVLAVSVILFVLMLNFYKKPKRVYDGDLLGYVNAPTDGKIVAIEKTLDKD